MSYLILLLVSIQLDNWILGVDGVRNETRKFK